VVQWGGRVMTVSELMEELKQAIEVDPNMPVRVWNYDDMTDTSELETHICTSRRRGTKHFDIDAVSFE
jgi:hypothetical protein